MNQLIINNKNIGNKEENSASNINLNNKNDKYQSEKAKFYDFLPLLLSHIKNKKTEEEIYEEYKKSLLNKKQGQSSKPKNDIIDKNNKNNHPLIKYLFLENIINKIKHLVQFINIQTREEIEQSVIKIIGEEYSKLKDKNNNTYIKKEGKFLSLGYEYFPKNKIKNYYYKKDKEQQTTKIIDKNNIFFIGEKKLNNNFFSYSKNSKVNNNDDIDISATKKIFIKTGFFGRNKKNFIKNFIEKKKEGKDYHIEKENNKKDKNDINEKKDIIEKKEENSEIKQNELKKLKIKKQGKKFRFVSQKSFTPNLLRMNLFEDIEEGENNKNLDTIELMKNNSKLYEKYKEDIKKRLLYNKMNNKQINKENNEKNKVDNDILVNNKKSKEEKNKFNIKKNKTKKKKKNKNIKAKKKEILEYSEEEEIEEEEEEEKEEDINEEIEEKKEEDNESILTKEDIENSKKARKINKKNKKILKKGKKKNEKKLKSFMKELSLNENINNEKKDSKKGISDNESISQDQKICSSSSKEKSQSLNNEKKEEKKSSESNSEDNIDENDNQTNNEENEDEEDSEKIKVSSLSESSDELEELMDLKHLMKTKTKKESFDLEKKKLLYKRRGGRLFSSVEIFKDLIKNQEIINLNRKIKKIYDKIDKKRKKDEFNKKRNKYYIFSFVGADLNNIEEIEKIKKMNLARLKLEIRNKISQGKYHIYEIENFEIFENTVNKIKLDKLYGDKKRVKQYVHYLEKYFQMFYNDLIDRERHKKEEYRINKFLNELKYEVGEVIPYVKNEKGRHCRSKDYNKDINMSDLNSSNKKI